MSMLSVTEVDGVFFHNTHVFTLIRGFVKCKRFFETAGSKQAGLLLDSVVLKRITGVNLLA